MRHANPLVRTYNAALHLYPRPFHHRYAAEMQLLFADLLNELPNSRARTTATFAARIAADLIPSILKEHIAMFTRRTFARVLALQAVLLIAVTTVIALLCYTTVQQTMRTSANDPQIQLAADAANRIAAGSTPAAALPALPPIDPALTPSPFVIIYNDAGVPLATTATFNRTIPAPPAGVFTYLRSHPEDRITWKPGIIANNQSLRIAAVLRPYTSAQGSGFILAGRTLTETESRISQIGSLVLLAWCAAIACILLMTFIVYRLIPPNPAPPVVA